MGNIVFQSDYGLGSGTSQLEGICRRVDAALQTYVLSHDIPRQDIKLAGDFLAQVVPTWPAGTVLVSLVETPAGTELSPCAAKLKNGCYVVSSTEQVLLPLQSEVETLVRIGGALTKYPYPTVSPLLHGKDYAWVGAMLASGKASLSELAD